MLNISTMAIEINEATYPIAVACLPARFAMHSERLVFGCLLVINARMVVELDNGRQALCFVNAWMTWPEFKENFAIAKADADAVFSSFVPVTVK